jgi:hypothetical protein
MAQEASEPSECLKEPRDLHMQLKNPHLYDKLVRQRFPSTYKRDKLKSAGRAECENID